MTLVFTILKFVCTFVSGFGAVLAAIPEHRRHKPGGNAKLKRFWRKLNTKETGLYIAIVGLFLALLSQFVETKLDTVKEAEDKQATDRLLRNILRIETRFDHIEVDLRCTLNPLDQSFTNYLRGFAIPGVISNAAPPLDGLYSGNIVGYANNTADKNSVTFSIDANATNTDVRSGPLSIPVNYPFTENWIRRGVSPAVAREVNALINTSLLLVEFGGVTNSEYGGKLSVLAYPQNPENIDYIASNNTFRISLRCETATVRSINKHYASITDLPHDTLSLSLYDSNWGLRGSAKGISFGWEANIYPESGEIQLGDFSLPLGDLKPRLEHDSGQPVVTMTLRSPIEELEDYGY